MRLQREDTTYQKAEKPLKTPRLSSDASSHLSFLLQLTQKLQTSLDTQRLLEIFFYSIQFNVPVDGIGFVSENKSEKLQIGQPERHQCHYKLAVEDNAIGELTFSRKQKFARDEIMDLEVLTGLLTLPINNALLYRAAVKHATTDALTDTGNRAHFNDTLVRELKLTQRHHYNLSLLLIDVDLFKSINDQYGHQVGDQALQRIVDGIRAMTRDTDRIFRFGGDEFVVLLDNTDEARARLVGERIRMNIENSKQQYPLLPKLSVTIGTATLLPDDTQEKLFARADSALYRAKRRGRNCVESSLSDFFISAC